jgi:hypothetical protein
MWFPILKSLWQSHYELGPVRRNQARTRLSVEQLEDRTVPSNFTAASVSELIADINAANLTAEADTITLAARKSFTLTAVDNTEDGANGLPVIGANEILTIIGNGDVIERSTGTGTPAFRLFDVAQGGSLALENMILQGGLAFVQAEGGAVYNQGSLILSSVTVQNNTAQGADGSIIYGTPLPGHSAAGGGLYSNGTLTVAGCTFKHNAAIGGQGADARQSFSGASGGAGLGGGVFVAGGTVTLQESSVIENVAKGGAGGKGGKGQPAGATGPGIGGGIYIDNTLASAGLDAFTVNHLQRNHASASDNDIHGSYDLIP